uniref:Uncharacterized protein n=1 Tax=uncultured marine virus TaxID=186617 RepID=A0A0F7L6D5_9VIRU|nr:hypothetical protein [uncultured marine virus]
MPSATCSGSRGRNEPPCAADVSGKARFQDSKLRQEGRQQPDPRGHQRDP